VLSSQPLAGGTRLDTAEAAGGPAFLVISGRHRRGEPDCGPSIIPIRALPGYPQRSAGPERHRIPVPTCQATLADMIEIPAGPFIYGGPGDPPSPLLLAGGTTEEQVVSLSSFHIDRTEASNAFFRVFAEMARLTAHRAPVYFDSEGLQDAARPASPVSSVDWDTSLVFCRFLGKELPTEQQWQRVARGPLFVDGERNDRTFPWGHGWLAGAARVRDTSPGVRPPCTHPRDVSLDGVCDLTGNVQEWTMTAIGAFDGRVVRGASWDTDPTSPQGTMVDFMAIPNPRVRTTRQYDLGFRCVRHASGTAIYR
jgi:formylglycine-generating enzyme required for sulfatase activity